MKRLDFIKSLGSLAGAACIMPFMPKEKEKRGQTTHHVKNGDVICFTDEIKMLHWDGLESNNGKPPHARRWVCRPR